MSKPLSLAAGALCLLIMAPAPAQAMPNYAREAGVSCFSCHSKPARDIGAANILPQPDKGSLIYSAPIGNIRTGLSLHKKPADVSQAVGGDAADGSALLFTGRENGYGAVTGLSGFAGGESFNVSLSLFRPDGAQGEGEDDLSLQYRLAFTPKLGGLDLAFGLFGGAKAPKNLGYIAGGSRSPLARAQSFGLDAKIGGNIGALSLDIKAMYLTMPDGKPAAGLMKTLDGAVDGYGAAAQVGFNKQFGLSAAYKTYKGRDGGEGATEDVASIGAWVNFSNNTVLESQYTAFGADRSFLTDEGAFTLLFITGF